MRPEEPENPKYYRVTETKTIITSWSDSGREEADLNINSHDDCVNKNSAFLNTSGCNVVHISTSLKLIPGHKAIIKYLITQIIYNKDYPKN